MRLAVPGVVKPCHPAPTQAIVELFAEMMINLTKRVGLPGDRCLVLVDRSDPFDLEALDGGEVPVGEKDLD